MRLAFISDIHGNARALESVLKDIETRNVDQLFVLGDISYRGLEPQCSAEIVQRLDAKVIKGNADEWIVRGVQEGEVPGDKVEMMNQEKEWSRAHMKDKSVTYLKELPEEINEEYQGVKIHAFHATPSDLFEVVLPSENDDVLKEQLMVNEIADIYVYGHIHKPYVRHIDGKVVVNTGSVGLPFDGMAKPSYAIIDIEENSVQTSIVRTEYDLESLLKDVQSSDYPQKDLLNKLLTGASPV